MSGLGGASHVGGEHRVVGAVRARRVGEEGLLVEHVGAVVGELAPVGLLPKKIELFAKSRGGVACAKAIVGVSRRSMACVG